MARSPFIVSLTVVSGCLWGTANADITCDPWHPEQNSPEQFTIGKILINPQNIFDPKDPEENHWYHQLGNKLHIKSRESTVSQQLIFSPGDTLDLRKLEESERILRSNEYIKAASVRPIEVCENTVNIRVTTIDHWSFTPSVSFERTGGENTSTTDIEESNLFGLGKKLVLLYDDGLERTSRSIRYKDRNLFGSRYTLGVSASDNSDGDGYGVKLALPFFQLDSRSAWSINNSDMESDIALYQAGDEFNRFGSSSQKWGVNKGWSKGFQNDRVNRVRAGWFHSETEFSAVSSTVDGVLPENRTLSYPWISYERKRERFLKIPNLSVMDETQDVPLGDEFSILGGFAAESFGADATYGVLQAAYSLSYQPKEHQLTQFSSRLSSTVGNGHQSNTTLAAQIEWYHFLSRRYTFLLSGLIENDSSPSLDSQRLIGADTGMRGFPIRYQAGNSRVLVNAEQRHMYSVYPWRLFQVASAVFIDAGSAWYRGDDPDWLADAGFGLRIFPTRSSGETVVHMDLAFPINADDDVDAVQINITTKTGF